MGCGATKQRPDVEEQNEMAQDVAVPEFIPAKGDEVEGVLANLSKKYNVKITRKGPNTYYLDDKEQLTVQMKGEFVLARVGGGWEKVEIIFENHVKLREDAKNGAAKTRKKSTSKSKE